MVLKLLAPVFDERDSALLAEIEIFLEDFKELLFVVLEVFDYLITLAKVINVAEGPLTQFESDEDPKDVHEHFLEVDCSDESF